MFRLSLALAIRNLTKRSFYTLINVFGLTIGLTACLVIMVYVVAELSYDKFNTNADRIVRVDWDLRFGENTAYNAAVTPPMAAVLSRDYPEVEAAARLRYMGSFQFSHEEYSATEWRVVYADNDLFKIFTLPFVAGDAASALTDPNSIVITRSCAEQFFPGADALGKILLKDNNVPYKVTGIVEDIPETSHFHFRMFLSMEGLDESKNGNWIGGPYNTYVLLRNAGDASTLEAKLPGMVEKYVLPQAEVMLGSTFIEDFKSGGNKLILHLRPLLDIHLHSHLRNELEPNGDIDYVYLLSAIAVFILLLACINFMNLSTARSAERAREVGIRKVLGSKRVSLSAQFLSEAVILTLVSFILALTFTSMILPLFNLYTGLHLSVPYNNWVLNGSLLLAAIVIGLISGSYPAFILSSFKPVNVLKGKLTVGRESISLRSVLVVFQFFVSIVLIIATIALTQQMNFLRGRRLGFNKEEVILLHDVKNIGSQLSVIRDQMVDNNLIVDGTVSSYFPGPGSARNTPLMWKYGEEPNPDNSVNAEKWSVDYDYITTLNMEIIEGRNFSRDFPSDSSAVILNETAVRRFGFTDSPIGQKISRFRDNPDGSQDKSKIETWTIIGIVSDFNFESLRQGVAPLGLFFGTESRGFLALRFHSSDPRQVIDHLQSKWKAILPGEPFNYSFLSDDFQRFYSSEEKLGGLFVAFSLLAIIIACLGLFALTAFSAERRTKEIGIRKVLGADVRSVLLLLSSEYSRLVLYGFIIAAPLAWFGIDRYLEQYAYKTQISLLIYPAALLIALVLAGLTTTYHAFKAASANPVNALKTD